jgi:hypothetical protein
MPLIDADNVVEQAVRWMNNNLRGSLPEKLKALEMNSHEINLSHPNQLFRNMSKYLDSVAELDEREKLPDTDEIYKMIFKGMQPKDWAESLYKARKIHLSSVEDVFALLEKEVKKLSMSWGFI